MNAECVEEMWPIRMAGWTGEQLYVRAEVIWDKPPGYLWDWLDLMVTYRGSDLWDDGWRLTPDGRMRRWTVQPSPGEPWQTVMDWPGANPARPAEVEPLPDGKERMLPVYEAKMLHLYDARWATYEPDGTVRRITDEEKTA